jgi:hypothetical protein
MRKKRQVRMNNPSNSEYLEKLRQRYPSGDFVLSTEQALWLINDIHNEGYDVGVQSEKQNQLAKEVKNDER